MSKYYEFKGLSGYTATHTDHSQEIAALRVQSRRLMRKHPAESATLEQAIANAAFETAAALLEVHDDTGISLDEWIGPRQLVERCLEAVGHPDTFLENHV